jgi:hypothetical protein
MHMPLLLNVSYNVDVDRDRDVELSLEAIVSGAAWSAERLYGFRIRYISSALPRLGGTIQIVIFVEVSRRQFGVDRCTEERFAVIVMFSSCQACGLRPA